MLAQSRQRNAGIPAQCGRWLTWMHADLARRPLCSIGADQAHLGGTPRSWPLGECLRSRRSLYRIFRPCGWL